MSEKREKFYTVSARLVFSAIAVLVILALVVGLSIVINKSPIVPLLSVFGTNGTVYGTGTNMPSNTPSNMATQTTVYPIIISVACSSHSLYVCQNPYFNATSGIFTVALSQNTGYNWTLVTVRFVPSNTTYSHGVPELSWAPPQTVNVTDGLLSNQTKYINIPITSGPVSVGSNITGSIWAKYQMQAGGHIFYANMSSAYIVIKR